MILQEIAKYYRRKALSGSDAIAPEGWIRRPIDYFVVLSREGECVDVYDNSRQEGKRRIAKQELVPAIGKQALKHTNSGKDANLLWDNAAFALGFGEKSGQKLSFFLDEIEKWFPETKDEALIALQKFLLSMRIAGAASRLLTHFGLAEDFEKREPVIAFRWQPDDAIPIHQRPSLMALYEQGRGANKEGAVLGSCLVFGDTNVPIAVNETVIKGVRNAQTSGANLVSFNERAFESYGKRKRAGENAPIGTAASFAYSTALNHLLRYDSSQNLQIGDATTVFWADQDSDFENEYAVFFDEPTKDDPDKGAKALKALFAAAEQGVGPFLEDKTRFFVLGLAPNAARIAIRFWQVGTVADVATRILHHFENIRIDAPDNPPFLSIRLMLRSIAPPSDKWPGGDPERVPPNLGGEVMRAILEGSSYPETLYYGVVRRVRAERSVSYPRAAILKACLNRKRNPNEKEITVSLDKENINPGYRLGRLFAVLERVQEEANPRINATIRDRYYGAFSATPPSVFSTLMRLKNHHLAKLQNHGRRVNLEKLIGEIVDGLPPTLPTHLSLADQGRFAIGYYHQRMNPSTYGK